MSELGRMELKSKTKCIGGRLRLGFNDPTRYFHIVTASSEYDKKQGRNSCAPHPSFSAFNSMGYPKDPDDPSSKPDPREVQVRRMIRGVVCAANLEDWSVLHRRVPKMKQHPVHQHPRNGPSCEGDGKRAKRWFNDSHLPGGGEYRDIECPGDMCQFNKVCPPTLTLHFQVKWSPFGEQAKVAWPAIPLRYVSAAWHTADFFEAMVKEVKQQAEQLGVENFSWYGFPFVMTSETKGGEKDGQKTRFPVVRFAPEISIAQWLMNQANNQQQLAAIPPMKALTGPEQEELEADDIAILHTP